MREKNSRDVGVSKNHDDDWKNLDLEVPKEFTRNTSAVSLNKILNIFDLRLRKDKSFRLWIWARKTTDNAQRPIIRILIFDCFF